MATMASLTPAQHDALIRAEQKVREEVRDRLVDYATSLWGSLGSWRDADVDRFVDAIVPRVLAGQRTVASLTDVYLAAMTGQKVGAVIDLAALRGGVTPDDVYRRPAKTLYTKLSAGQPFEVAMSAATARLVSVVRTDLHLAMRGQARQSLSRLGGVGGFRRTLTGRENCTLCAIASTQRYHRGDLLPIHPGCDCGVEPLSDRDVHDQIIDQGLLEQIHEQVGDFTGTGDRGARDLGRGKSASDGSSVSDFTDLIITREHGEYGPTLAWRGQHFIGPANL